MVGEDRQPEARIFDTHRQIGGGLLQALARIGVEVEVEFSWGRGDRGLGQQGLQPLGLLGGQDHRRPLGQQPQ